LTALVDVSPRWWLIEAITSSTVTVRPEWKLTPSRMPKTQVTPSALSQLVAISGTSWPSAPTSISWLWREAAKTCT
jgi:hypothetical protein